MACGSGDIVTIKPEYTETSFAVPLDIQHVEHALRIEPFLDYVERFIGSTSSLEVDDGGPSTTAGVCVENKDSYNGVATPKSERKADKSRLFNLGQVKKGRKWLKNLLLSDSSSSEDEGGTIPNITAADIKEMLKNHTYEKKCKNKFYHDKEAQQFSYYSAGLLSSYDKYSEKSIMASKAKKEQRKLERKMKKIEKMKEKEDDSDSDDEPPREYAQFRTLVLNNKPGAVGRPSKKDKKITPEQMAMKRRKLWVAIAKKEIPKAQKLKANSRKDVLTQWKKVAKECQKDCRKQALQSQKVMREAQIRARRLCKEMQAYWKRFDKVEKEHRKKAEREAQEQRKVDMETQEMKRQQRKLNFLITQTELYAHFMARKMTGQTEDDKDAILSRLDDASPQSQQVQESKGLVDLHGDSYSADEAKERAIATAKRAYNMHKQKVDAFDLTHMGGMDPESELANPIISTAAERPQPSLFEGKLKGYQLKGMNWLANLYDQGINGILADEMGLGKTVQSIALLAYLAETHGIWGPFLIVSPASTLHNWQQEVSRFLPKLKVVPYWGNTQDRKVLRKFWNQENLHSQDASFHLVITSYQLVIQDLKYFSRITWHYMILDEAQAIKSQNSVRWKILLDFKCRNRLLLTGTPIQNTMQELWALLHFIMPTLFDSHDEFSEWFSKDIENHAENKSGIDEKHLSRLHMILKPFMLRRVKKDVENELSDKIEVLMYCPLTTRQRLLYQAVKNKIRVEDLLVSSLGSSSTSTSSLMNLVMQFRKVCNHPELFERKEVKSPYYMKLESYHIPRLVFREGLVDAPSTSNKHLLFNKLCIFNEQNVHSSLFPQSAKESVSHSVRSCFSFTRFAGLSASELKAIMLQGLLARWLGIFEWFKEAYRIHHRSVWQTDILTPHSSTHLQRTDFQLQPLRTTCFTNLTSSHHLQGLVFTDPCSTVHAHLTWTIHSTAETLGHRKIRLRHHSGKKTPTLPTPSGSGTSTGGEQINPLLSPSKKTATSPRTSTKSPISPIKAPTFESHENVFVHRPLPPQTHELMPSDVPTFLYHTMQKTMAKPMGSYCPDRMAEWATRSQKLCGTPEAFNCLLYGTTEAKTVVQSTRHLFNHVKPAGLYAVMPKNGYSGVFIPDKETLVTDAGKLYVLDMLLSRLKAEGHRVLIYSQMTRMIDIIEEYMWHRNHTYMRLDGSSKISERRDMVADFQTRSDIFVFLLSTRAGGLGINLTAADTVIFYDSDWNPTVDQQAMDRAHRLGQTKQVTVYRLICKGTIEERILQRAKEKSEIQKMVISGGNYKPDVLRPKEVVSLLLDDDELEKKFKQRQDDKQPGPSSGGKFMGIKRKVSKSGRGPGRPKKKKEEEDVLDDSTGGNVESMPPSPQSMLSQGSEALQVDESSNDATQLVVDDIFSVTPSAPSTPSGKKTSKSGDSGRRGRGRPKGSGGLGRRRGRGSVQKALSAAEAAAMQVGLSKGYAAYGYSMGGGNGDGSGQSTPVATTPPPLPHRSPSRGRGRPKASGFLSRSKGRLH